MTGPSKPSAKLYSLIQHQYKIPFPIGLDAAYNVNKNRMWALANQTHI